MKSMPHFYNQQNQNLNYHEQILLFSTNLKEPTRKEHFF
jgi:hypothetical protein